MLVREVCDAITLSRENRLLSILAGITVLLTLGFGICISFLAGFAIFTSYIAGFFLCWVLLKSKKSTSFCLRRLASFCNEHTASYYESSKHFRPSNNLVVNQELNDAVEHLFNRILSTYVESWYKTFTDDATFTQELRVSLRYSTTNIVNRILNVEKGKVIADKLVPCAVKHVDDYLSMQKNSESKNLEVNGVAVEYWGSRLHFAVTNRHNELNYLRHLVACLLPYIIPEQYVDCRSYTTLIREILAGWVFLPLMDVLASPAVINSLVILIANYKSKNQATPRKQPQVELLHNFAKTARGTSSFALDLKTVFRSPELLQTFKSYLKREGAACLLSFCTDIEEFNVKLLSPELTKGQLENLHAEATNLFQRYFEENSCERIRCSKDIASRFEQLLNDGVYNVAKLRTSEPLYEAYDYAFGTLEADWLPKFFHSNEFYGVICGSKATPGYSKSSKTRNMKSGQGAVAKISSGLGKIKGALKPNQPIEGAMFYSDPNIFTNEMPFIEGIFPGCENMFRDLNTWKVSIASAEYEQLTAKSECIFKIDVQRINDTSGNDTSQWCVMRREQDFYTLKTKLAEFHGEVEIPNTFLPPKRMAMSPESRRTKNEEFLRYLLQKPNLKGSDLLHMFLTTKQNFTLMVTASMPVVEDLSNIYQSVAFKLRKEKGQHLDNFMATFLSSTLKTQSNKFDVTEVGDDATVASESPNPFPATFTSNTFNNNFGIPHQPPSVSSFTFNPSGLTESLFYLGYEIFKVRYVVLKMYAAVCSIVGDTIESLCQIYIDKQLRSSLSQSNITYLVGLLEDVIFGNVPAQSKEELEKQKTRAFMDIRLTMPALVHAILGEGLKDGLVQILEVFQNPVCNKQVAYSLLDIVVMEMFPELSSPSQRNR